MAEGLFRKVAVRIPAALVAARFLIALVLLADSLDGKTGLGFVVLFVVAFLSDVFDGIIARRLGVASPRLRQWDGYADILLYSVVLISIRLTHPLMIQRYFLWISALLLLQVISWIFSLIKFGKMTSYHSYIAKLWGLSLFAATIGIFYFESERVGLVPVVIGFISIVEDITMTAILPCWKNDILTVYQALQVRRTHEQRAKSP